MTGTALLVLIVVQLKIISLCSGFVHVSKLSPVIVEIGRSVLLDPDRNLKITFPTGALCRVTVLRNDPLSQRVGFLVPDVFPCDFAPGDVHYTHLGSMFFMQDFVRLQIRADTATETRLIPLNLRVTINFSDMEIVKKNQPITVVEPGGISSSINNNVLQFKNDPGKMCSVTLLVFNSQIIPRYGKLVNVSENNESSAQFECSEFLQSNLRYQHTKTSSSNRDFIPLVVELIDQTFGRVEREYFQIIVRIMGARSNQRPVASFQSTHTVEVNQYTIAPITFDILAASDTETEAGEIIFNITQALQPSEGYLVNTDGPYQPLTAFYQKDIEQLKIAYRPPVKQTNQLRMFQVVLEAVDTEGAKSEPILLLIMVKPTNNRAPVVIKNAGLSLFEGQSRAITDKINLAIADKDNFDDVRLQVVGGLRHGELRILGHKIDTFMVTDLEIPVITYHHDNSETYSDNIIFRLSDGEHDVRFLFPITIGPVDDMAPTLVFNTGIALDEGDLTLIDQYMLSATDIDSEDSKIQFKVVKIPDFEERDGSSISLGSEVGTLCLRRRELPVGEENWVLQEDGMYEKNVTQFSQKDIQERLLYYRHFGGEHFSEKITFVLFDHASKPNVSPLQTLQVTIRKLDDLAPSLYLGSSLELIADEFSLSEIPFDALRYTDNDSDDDELTYFITKEPHFIDRPKSTLAGNVILWDIEMKVLKFTQLQLRHKKVAFQAPDIEIGSHPRHVQFEFSVSDLSGNAVKNQLFRILLKPINNKAPRVEMKQLEVTEFGEGMIGSDLIAVSDEDTPVDDLKFILCGLPRYGVVLKDKKKMKRLDTFTVQDVQMSRMWYRHVVQGEASDEMRMEVDDGAQKTSFRSEIVIKPQQKNVTCHVYNMTVKVKEHSKEPIRIHTASPSPNDGSVMLRVATPPRVGRILRADKISYEFSVQDLEAGLVYYEHTGRETGLQGDLDHFNMTLSNSTIVWFREGRRYQAIDVITMILPVDSQPPMVSRIQQLVVPEGGKSQLTSRHLTITDPDTRDIDVICSVDVQPTVGFLENVTPSPGSEISNAGKRVTSFTIVDIRAGLINYVQETHAGSEPTMDWVAFSCSDGNNTSPRYLLNIDIHPRNDEKPQIFTRDFVVNEGDEMIVDVAVLNAVDADEPLDELIFHVDTQPRHGIITDRRLGATTSISRFSLTQIRKSTSIVYQHDGSESTNDSFLLTVSDGMYNTTREIPIVIVPVDDEEPLLAVNTGLRLSSIGQSKTITPRNLQAHDVDSPDANITFIVRSPPRAGLLKQIHLNGSVEILTLWGKFRQLDIDARRIVYFQDSNIPSERDQIKFDLSDGQNALLNQDFYVEISTGDRIHPTVVSKGVYLVQNSRVVLSTNFLSASDTGSPNEKLKYTLIKQPLKGHVEHLDAPGVRLETFTQLDLAENKIAYVHTSQDEGTADSFDFEVSDGTNGVVRTFLITLLNKNDKKPVMISTKLVVKEGEDVLITQFELRAEDQDTRPEDLLFTVTRVPLHGWLLRGGMPTRVFSQADIALNQISYAHDGTDVERDSFEVVVSDGANSDFYVFPDTQTPLRKSHEIAVVVLPVDNRIPRLVRNRGATTLHALPGNRLGLVICGDVLRVEDRDSNNSELLYTVTSPPENGYIVLSGHFDPNTSVTNFSQADLDAGQVSYLLRRGSNATNDAFEFDVHDPAGNALRFQRFSLTWAWVSFEGVQHEVNESDGIVRLVVLRKGFLGEVSFVRMSVKGLTATRDEDFSIPGAGHVQFSPGQSRSTWKLHVLDDDKYEINETLEVQLAGSRMCVITQPSRAHVIIKDPEDIPSVEVVRSAIVVEESIGEVNIPIRRTGDVDQLLHVTCLTDYQMKDGWATGALPTSVLSYSDFISRPDDKSSVLVFEKGEIVKDCPITIIDDSLYENEERFLVSVQSYPGSKVNENRHTTEVIIAPDVRDEPKVFFERQQYFVDESVGSMEVYLGRAGTDLSKSSSVFVRSRQTDPISARASEDYVPVIQMVYFAPFSERERVEVTIRDDQGLPTVEGNETFELLLRTPINAGFKETQQAVITIDDSMSDLPIVQFEKASYSTNENRGTLNVVLMRTGDLRFTSSVRCYTRQMTSQVDNDFKERPDTGDSTINFEPGEYRKVCPVVIMDDTRYEGKELLRLRIGSAGKNTRIGGTNTTVITILDEADKPVIQFLKERVFVAGPVVRGGISEALITVTKTGDLSIPSQVRVYTLDGSGRAGHDYQPMTQILEFAGNHSTHTVKIEIMFAADRKIRRAFSVRLSSDVKGESEIGTKKMVVYIEQRVANPAVTFPLLPRVVSLRDYDDVSKASREVIMGYPVICVTACDPKYPRFAETGSLCSSQRINNALTQYRWRINGEFRNLDAETFYTKTDMVTLDSVYLVPGSRVQCVARAVSHYGELGLESSSAYVNVSKKNGLCMSRDPTQQFVASISFTGAGNEENSNRVHIKVIVPHSDGLIPVVSTKKLVNFKRILRPGVLRQAQHKCSNLLDANEITTRFGFVTNVIKDPENMNEGEPYQFSVELRGNRTLRFYRSLDLESCLWTFNSYYDISELIQYCGATVTSDGHSRDVAQSQLTVRVPLFVSLLYRAPKRLGAWVHYDHATYLRLHLTYDTAVLLNKGVRTPEGGLFNGDLWPTAISVREEDKRLVVNFKTKTKFRGTYLLKNPDNGMTALIMSRDRPHMSFRLNLLASEPTFDYPQQSWRFTSQYALRDYSGVYFIKLIPCTADEEVPYSDPPRCHPRDPVTFTLPIRFQQVPDPVPAQFTLSAQFLLMSERELWLTPDRKNAEELRIDSAFARDSKIYGRITLLEGYSLGKGDVGYTLSAEKVFLCTGVGEYVPTYDPNLNEFGCLARSNHLEHQLKVLDKEEPDTVEKQLASVPFDAKFADEEPTASSLSTDPATDGFVMSSAPLFEVPRNRKWYMHAIYSVSPGNRKRPTRSLGLSSSDFHDLDLSQLTSSHVLTQLNGFDYQRTHRLGRRNIKDVQEIGLNGKGTNIKMIRLLREPAETQNKSSSRELEQNTGTRSDQSLVNPLVIGIASVCVVLLIALVVVGVSFRRRLLAQQCHNSPPVETNSREVTMTKTHGVAV